MTATLDGRGRRIKVQDATIRTAAVEVKSLTISGKQVTLAVFRQLPEVHIVTADAYLCGVPWGWVNYCPGTTQCDIAEWEADRLSFWREEEREENRYRRRGYSSLALPEQPRPKPVPHRHVVWQQGDELRRCPVPVNFAQFKEYYRGIRDGTPHETIADTWRELSALDQLFIAV